MPFLLRCLCHGHARCAKHIFDENAVARCGIVDENMRHSTDELTVLDDRRAGHECGQVGTTKFNENFIKNIVLG